MPESWVVDLHYADLAGVVNQSQGKVTLMKMNQFAKNIVVFGPAVMGTATRKENTYIWQMAW